MDQPIDVAVALEQEGFDWQACRQLEAVAFSNRGQFERLGSLLKDLDEQTSRMRSDRTAQALKLGLCYHMLGRHAQAAQWLAEAPPDPARTFALAQSLRGLGRFDEALAAFDEAAAAGWDRFEATMQRVATQLAADRLEAAEELLSESTDPGRERAEWHFQYGRLLEKRHQLPEATEAYSSALEIDPDHTEALFRLAYLKDLGGDDDEAIECYERCIETDPAYVNALMNLAVLYEDRGSYEKACSLLRQVLAVEPNHARARLFLRDAEASIDMTIDEEQERVREQRNAVLDIPISDFELSVRSRNCLKKMNLNSLGDLLHITEPELLGYKNFGETSLLEIKTMLATKGLRLGQALEEQKTAARREALQQVVGHASPEVLNRPVSELELSVRARKCLQRLNIATVGELASRNESELLSVKNFGTTSLNEIKQRLAELGLSMRPAKT